MTMPPAPLCEETLRFGAEQLAERDPDLRNILSRLGYPPLWAREPGFASLIHIILEQQVSIKAAATMFRRLSLHLSGVSPESVLEIGEEGLRQFGLTRQKSRYAVELARHVSGRQLRLDQLDMLDDVQGRKDLLAVPGLGPWTVDIYYMMALRRPDIWPRGDLALASAIRDIKQLEAIPGHSEQYEFALQWSPWRAVAARMLWLHYLDARGAVPFGAPPA